MNRTKIKAISRSLGPFAGFSTKSLQKSRHHNIILVYHGISKGYQFNCVREDVFADQMSWLKENYSVVPLSELVNRIKLHDDSQPAMVAITFDDGYVNFAELALPLLERLGVHATVFVPTGKIGGYNDWDETRKEFHRMPIMSYPDLRQLPTDFVEIGSHGVSHAPLDQLSEKDVEKEITESRFELEQRIGKPVQMFAFPFGVYLPWRSRELKKFLISYQAACTSRWGRHNSLKDIYMLRRIGIWDSDSLGDFVDKMKGYYDWLVIKEEAGRFYKAIRHRNGRKTYH